jgi:thymidylate synthase (FAD)
MEFVKPSFEILDRDRFGDRVLKKLELCGRVSYKSEARIADGTDRKFVEMLKSKGDWSVLEHEVVSVRIVCDRGVTHELVRHRIASYTQESTRFCRYAGGIRVIQPPFRAYLEAQGKNDLDVGEAELVWRDAVLACESAYLRLLDAGLNPSLARSVLPNSLKTEIVVTANLRAWHHVFRQRTAKAAHPQMREIMLPLLAEFKRLIPILYDDLPTEEPGQA